MPAIGTTTIIYKPDGTAEVSRSSPLTRGVVTRTLPLTVEQILKWEQGALIQNAMPHLTADQREFLLTGMSDNDWNENFADDE